MNYKTVTGKYNQINFEERSKISFMLNELNYSLHEIARRLNRNCSSISREIKRNTIYGKYEACSANKKYLKRFIKKQIDPNQKYKEFTILFKKYYDKKWHGVEATWHRIITEKPDISHISLKQTYNLINSNNWIIKKDQRLRKKYRKGGKRSSGYFSKFNTKYVIPIWARENYINSRDEFGHWEIDLVIGRKSHKYRSLLTLTERKTRFNVIVPIAGKNPHILNAVLHNVIKRYNLVVKSVTSDNGLEFKCLGLFGYQTGISIYKCNPYASHERGTNENCNGLIRRQFPKKTDFNKIKNVDIEILMDDINNMPRKMFNFKSANQMYIDEIKKIDISSFRKELREYALIKRKNRTTRRHGYNYLKKFNSSF